MYTGQLFHGLESDTHIADVDQRWADGCPACTEEPKVSTGCTGITRPNNVPIGRMDATVDGDHVIVLVEVLCGNCGYGEVGYDRTKSADFAEMLGVQL